MTIYDKLDELEGLVGKLEKQISAATRQLAHAPMGDTFDSLVAEEIRKGCPPSVAAQKIVNLYGTNPPASALRKHDASAVVDFMGEVDRTMIEKGCSRSDAMREVRKRDPAAFRKYQEV